MFASIKHHINVAFLFSIVSLAAMEPQHEESSRRVARVMQEATNYNPSQPVPQLNARRLRQDNDNIPPVPSSIRQFPIEDYKKVKTLFSKQIINDSVENCPPSLSQDIEYLLEHSNSDHPVIKSRLPNRFIFVGPSGCGKTTLSYALAYKTKRPYVFVKSADLSNSFKDSYTDIISNLFKPMIDCKQPGLIIFDEFMAFVKKYNNHNDSDSGAVERLWQELDGAKLANPRLVVICTANDISNLPSTLLTRFGGSQHTFEQPSDTRREKLIKQILHPSEQIAHIITTLVNQTKDISLRELSECLNKAQLVAAIRSEKTKTEMIVITADIFDALKPVLKEYSARRWAKRKEKVYEIAKTTAPYVITISLAAAGMWLSYYLYTKQAAQAEKAQQETLKEQKALQKESQDFAQKQHDAAHSPGAIAKQTVQSAVSGAAGSAAGALVSFLLYRYIGIPQPMPQQK